MHRKFQCRASMGLVALLDGPSGDSCPFTDHGEPCARNRSLADRGHNSRSKIKQLAHVRTNRDTDTANRASNENNGKKPYTLLTGHHFHSVFSEVLQRKKIFIIVSLDDSTDHKVESMKPTETPSW